MFERFSDEARRVVVGAQEDARIRDHNYIGSEHLLLALVRDRHSVACRALESMGVDLADVRAQVDAAIGTGGSAPPGHIPFTPSAKKVLELALREALQLEDNFIGTEHILLGIVREGDGVGAGVLVTYGVELEPARQAVVADRGEEGAVAHGRQPSVAPTTGMLETWRAPMGRPTARCALCGRDQERVERTLVAGGFRLCSECAHAAVTQLDALPTDAPKLVRYRRRELAPSDEDAAIAAIERAFDAVLGPLAVAPADALWAVEGGPECLAALEFLREGAAHAPMAMSDQTLERVRFLDETEAEISLGLWPVGSSQPILQPAHAVLEDGTWKVRRSTVEFFARLAQQFRRPGSF